MISCEPLNMAVWRFTCEVNSMISSVSLWMLLCSWSDTIPSLAAEICTHNNRSRRRILRTGIASYAGTQTGNNPHIVSLDTLLSVLDDLGSMQPHQLKSIFFQSCFFCCPCKTHWGLSLTSWIKNNIWLPNLYYKASWHTVLLCR